jgi:aquaporin Z
MRTALGTHWPEFLMAAAGLGIFMLWAGGFAILIFIAASPVSAALSGPLMQRWLMGCAMGLTAVCLIYAPGMQ